MRFVFAPVLLFLVQPPAQVPAQAADLAAAFAREHVTIRSNFSGAEIIIFGAVENAPLTGKNGHHMIIALSGPPRTISIWQKQKIGAIWRNHQRASFEDVPAFFALTASAQPNAMLPAKRLEVLGLQPGPRPRNIAAENASGFADAFLRLMRQRGLWPEQSAPIEFLSPSLFRAHFFIPPLAVPGAYRADLFLLHQGQVIAQKRLSFSLERSGLAAQVFSFAHQHALFYGLLAVALALFLGGTVSALFARR